MKLNEIDEPTLCWLAGLLEGEGSFIYLSHEDKEGGSNYNVQISISMADKDIVEKVAKIFKTKVYVDKGPKGKNKDYKVIYKTYKYGFRALRWMQKLYPLVSKRRKKQIERCFNKVDLSVNEELPDKPHGGCKLTKQDVEKIRERFKNGKNPYDIAKDFPVSGSHVSNICYGRKWA